MTEDPTPAGDGAPDEPQRAAGDKPSEKPRASASEKPSALPRQRGVVKWFDPEIGYGFIDRTHGDDVFVHIADVQRSGIDRLYEGQQVEFDVKETQKGLQAENLSFVETETAVPAAPAAIGEITLAEVFYASALELFEQEGLDPSSVEAWPGIMLSDKDPSFRVDLDIVGPYDGESADEYFGRQVDIVDGLAKLAGLSLVRGAVTRSLRESRGLPVPDEVKTLEVSAADEAAFAQEEEDEGDETPEEQGSSDDGALDNLERDDVS